MSELVHTWVFMGMWRKLVAEIKPGFSFAKPALFLSITVLSKRFPSKLLWLLDTHIGQVHR